MAIAVLATSGGPGSATALWDLQRRGFLVECVHVDYGQASAVRELSAAAVAAAQGKQVGLKQVQIKGFPRELVPSSPQSENRFQHYGTLVLSVVWAHAVAVGAERVVCAVGAARVIGGFAEHLGVHFSQESRDAVALDAPYRECDPAWIVREGHKLGAPLDWTWSCLLGGELHCGICRGCLARREAFAIGGVPDWTDYERGEPMPAAARPGVPRRRMPMARRK